MRAWLALLLIAPLLAGCLAGDGTISARDGLADATKAARQWVDDPLVVSIASIEPFSEWVEEDFEFYVHLDPVPGDGKAPGWVYVFAGSRDGEPRTAFVVLAAGLGVIAEGFAKEDWGGEPLTAWPLDSTDIALILRGLDDWPTMGANTSVLWDLTMEAEGPVWCVYLEMPDEWAEACLDAVTGEVLEMERTTYAEVAITADPIQDRASGLVTPVTPLQVQIDMDRPGSVQVDYWVYTGLVSVELVLEGPDGFRDEMAGATPSGFGMKRFDGMPAGTYTLRATSQLAADMEISLSGF